VIFSEEKTPTLELPAGSISVYRAQFVFIGAVAGQSAFKSTEIFETELLSAGIVTARAAPVGKVIVCKAETEASMDAAADAFAAVTNPRSVAAPSVAPVSGVNGIAP
jgi:hypothetical protein